MAKKELLLCLLIGVVLLFGVRADEMIMASSSSEDSEDENAKVLVNVLTSEYFYKMSVFNENDKIQIKLLNERLFSK